MRTDPKKKWGWGGKEEINTQGSRLHPTQKEEIKKPGQGPPSGFMRGGCLQKGGA